MGGLHEFPETRRSVWQAIRAGGADLEKVLALYRDPIVGWLRRRGLGVEDAEDVSQDVLVRLADGVLVGADPARGRLRALVKAVSRHALADHRRSGSARKRGGAAKRLSLEGIEPATDEPADDFDAEWALNLVLQAIYRLLDGADDGKRQKVEAVYESAVKGRSMNEVASHLGVTVANAKVLAHRGRKLLSDAVRELVAEYASKEELDAELTFIERLLP